MTRYSRRRFLGSALAAAASVYAAPHIARAVAPNDTLGVAVVGVRGRGGSHISGYQSDSRTNIQYIVDVDEKVGQDRVAEVAGRLRRVPDTTIGGGCDVVGARSGGHREGLDCQ